MRTHLDIVAGKVTATLTLSASTISIPTSVPSGYARQAQLEATATNGFTAFKNGLVK